MYSPHYTISNKILKNIGIIEAAKEVIEHAPLVPAYEKKFREEALVRTVHHGTHIEGNDLSYTEAKMVLDGNEIVGRQRDVQEVINYRNVITFIDDLSTRTQKEPNKPYSVIDENVLNKIHRLTVAKLLPAEKCGVYRKMQVAVKNSLTGEISYTPPPAVEVPYLIEDFLDCLQSLKQDKIHPVLLGGITHLELVRIHPFLDGNGRVARAAATLVLFLGGCDIKRFFSLEEYFDKDVEEYYAALRSVADQGERGDGENRDLTEWLEYFSKGLAIEFNRVKEKVRRLSVDLKIKERSGQIALTERQIKIMEYVERNGYIQAQAFKQLFPKYSYDAIWRDVRELVRNNILIKQGKTKKSRYVMNK